jgi:glucose/arabinose dehydrogenase
VGAPTRDPRLFVGERAGRVWIIRDGARLPDPFLDLSAVTRTQGNEDGLLSVAFHPDYQTNRFVFVSFVELDGAIRLARFTASASDPNRVDPASRLNIRGKLVRLDVNTAAPFVVPSDNPFVGIAPFRPEVFALGLRNPWRFWVDEPTRQLFIADVGEGSFEELNVITLLAASGANFGWSFLEGPLCLPASPSCDLPGRVDPDVSYPHGPGCNSITGGVVYRGRAHPEHVGRYFYSDFCQGWLRSLRAANGEVSEQLEWTLSRPMPRITSFGLDGAGELYAVSYRGEVFRIGGGSR